MNRCGKTHNSVKKSESRRPAKLSRPQRVSVTGDGEGLSDGEAVISMFFLIRYQSVVAIRTHVNFTRQFSRVSLVSRTEGNFARQFFKSSLFIIAVQQNFRNALTKRLRSEIGLNSPPIANEMPPVSFGDASSGTSNVVRVETRAVRDSSKNQPAIGAEPA